MRNWFILAVALALLFSGCTAKSKLDQALDECSSIQYETFKESCRATVFQESGEFERCSETGYNNQTCQSFIAAKSDVLLCEKADCPDKCYFDAAKKANNFSICGRISDPGVMDYCYVTMFTDTITTDTSGICEKIKSERVIELSGCFGSGTVGDSALNHTFKEYCIAETKSSPEECATLSDDLRDSCLLQLAFRTGDCNLINYTSNDLENITISRAYCRMFKGIAKNDSRECDFLQEENMQLLATNCYLTLGVVMGDESLCGKIEEDFLTTGARDLCTASSRATSGGLESCNSLQDKDTMHLCRAFAIMGVGGDWVR